VRQRGRGREREKKRKREREREIVRGVIKFRTKDQKRVGNT